MGKRSKTGTTGAKGKTVTLDLEGHFLIAMPGMGDPRFDRSLIYVCAHSDSGAMGFVINRPLEAPTFRSLLTQLKICPEDEIETKPAEILNRPIYFGGPVEQARGFVLHSKDYKAKSTLLIDGTLGLTATLEALKTLVGTKIPQNSLLLLGYAGWAGGQLEQEILQNGWLTCQADADIIFHPDDEKKYDLALQCLGIDAGFLSAESGHA